MSALDIVNLVHLGMSQFDTRQKVPNYLPTHEQFVKSNILLSQQYLDQINQMTEQRQIVKGAFQLVNIETLEHRRKILTKRF